MQRLLNEELLGVQVKKRNLGWLATTTFIASTVVTLLAIFALSSWAEVSGWHHALQHVMIFVSGATAGGSILQIRKSSKED